MSTHKDAAKDAKKDRPEQASGFAAEAEPPKVKGEVEQASVDSFPASDPPGYGGATRIGDPKADKTGKKAEQGAGAKAGSKKETRH